MASSFSSRYSCASWGISSKVFRMMDFLFESFIHRQPHQSLEGITQMTTTIYAGTALDGALVKDYPWPPSCLILMVYRGEEEIVPHGDTRLQVGDTLVIQLTGASHLKSQQAIISGAHQVID